ncbi:MAG: hypothetical protein ACR2P0_05045 [Acidimicrobiales bacterium]
MRRYFAAVIALALVGAACGAQEVDVTSAQAPTEVPPTMAVAEETPEASVATATSTVIEAVPIIVPTGREALAAAEGTPHVLWFWGAH